MNDDIMFSTYVKFMYEYLLKNTNIDEVDNLFEICFDYNFPYISKEHADKYQVNALNYLKYFYVRNDININNLSDEEKYYIQNRIQENRLNYDDDINSFIQKTLPKVILKTNEKLGDDFLINYGPIGSEYYLASNKSLVIGFKYNDYVSGDLSNYEAQEEYLDREVFVEAQCYSLEQRMSKDLNMDVQVMEYRL